ncbi:MAG: cell division protein FtsL [Halieaceae bacterium]|jgi:cell division protein FtsL
MAESAVRLKGLRPRAIGVAVMLAIVASALGVVQTTHSTRQLHTELEQLESAGWGLEENWSRLLLEHSTWSAHHRVERVAAARLNMHVPEFGEIELVNP